MRPSASGLKDRQRGLNMSKAHELIDSIIEKRNKELGKKSELYPRKNPILSDIPDCDRQLVYGVLNWKERPPFDSHVAARLEAGNVQEREIVRELEGMGFRVILSQMPVEIKGRGGILLATGRIDGKIEFDGFRIPFEIKSMNPNIFNQVRSIEDFQKKPWLRKYVRQLMMYLFGNNAEQGIFICTDCLGAWKMFVLDLDLGECEHLLQRLERAYENIKAGTHPPRILYDQSICGKCPFASNCLQDIVNTPLEFIENAELEQTIDRHEELKPLASEYDELHDRIKGVFKGVEKAIIGGRWMVVNVPSARTTYELTEEAEAQILEIKKSFQKQVPCTRMVIEKVSEKKEEAA